MTAMSSLVIASNRGPLSFVQHPSGELEPRRGGGGLVSGLTAASAGRDALWVCAALSAADRAAARGGALPTLGSPRVRMLDIDPTTLGRAYNGIANSTLWFIHHHLYDVAHAPAFDRVWRRMWSAFTDYSAAFAEAIAGEAAQGATVLVQDYHLVLVPGLLRAKRPDVRIAHFSHTPWATPDYYRLLPDDVAAAVVEGIAAADHIGFLTERWAEAFIACAGSDVAPRVGVHSLGVDANALRTRACEPDARAAAARLRELKGDRLLLVRVDRTELSKNVVRGLLAYRELLRTRPQWHGRVTHMVLAYPSRHELP